MVCAAERIIPRRNTTPKAANPNKPSVCQLPANQSKAFVAKLGGSSSTTGVSSYDTTFTGLYLSSPGGGGGSSATTASSISVFFSLLINSNWSCGGVFGASPAAGGLRLCQMVTK